MKKPGAKSVNFNEDFRSLMLRSHPSELPSPFDASSFFD